MVSAVYTVNQTSALQSNFVFLILGRIVRLDRTL